MLAMLAVKQRAQGASAGETAAWLETKKHSCLAFFTVDDLMYLHRGGRLSKISALAGTVLGIKPLLNIAPDGTLRQKEKARGQRAALKLMLSQIKRSLAPGTALDTVLINHTDCVESAQLLASMIQAEFYVGNTIIMLMGPLIGAHLGPGAVTLLVEADMTREEYESRFYS
jgi:DegV family protein with EDD domain